jgi:hypothetical protein
MQSAFIPRLAGHGRKARGVTLIESAVVTAVVAIGRFQGPAVARQRGRGVRHRRAAHTQPGRGRQRRNSHQLRRTWRRQLLHRAQRGRHRLRVQAGAAVCRNGARVSAHGAFCRRRPGRVACQRALDRLRPCQGNQHTGRQRALHAGQRCRRAPGDQRARAGPFEFAEPRSRRVQGLLTRSRGPPLAGHLTSGVLEPTSGVRRPTQPRVPQQIITVPCVNPNDASAARAASR